MGAKNGLRDFSYHVDDPAAPAPIDAAHGIAGGEAAAAAVGRRRDSPEAVARRYLDAALARADLAEVTAAAVDGTAPDFDLLGVEAVPLTGTRTVKFRQRYHKIPVYGSLVTIELDPQNTLLGLTSALGRPDVSPVAEVSPARALARVRKAARLSAEAAQIAPVLQYYYDGTAGRWRLVYFFEDVPVRGGARTVRDGIADFIVDAHSGELVTELPRVHGLTERARDGLGLLRPIRVVPANVDGRRRMVNELDNVHTYDFGFRSYLDDFRALPGDYVEADGAGWSPAAVSAHYNASAVAAYLRLALRRNGVDDRGAPLVSSIDCIEDPPGPEWANAAWLPGLRQMIYGQRRLADGSLRSYALALDVVGHEIFHGVTSSTARLEYAAESGALNESLSDIFGVIVSNDRGSRRRRTDLWNWEIGEDLAETGGRPLRDMSQPARFGQPEHMDHYVDLPPDRDHGGVHVNSGIHNLVGYRLLTARSAAGAPLTFTPREVAALFYLCVTQHLGRTSVFVDARRGVVQAARTLFRSDPRAAAKVAAIEAAYDAAGIV